MDTIQINLDALEWLRKHTTLHYKEIVSRCPTVSPFRMHAILKFGTAFPQEVDEIAQALSVPDVVLTDVQGCALKDYAICHQVLEQEDDIANTAFVHKAVTHNYAARNTTGLPLNPRSAHDLYRQFKSTKA